MLSTTKARFSLYCIEDGEVYLGDLLGGVRCDDGWAYKGTIRLASRSIVVEPGEVTCPVVKVAFKHVKGLGVDGEDIVVACNEVTTMLRNGMIGSHDKLPVKGKLVISLQWEPVIPFLKRLEGLLEHFNKGIQPTLPKPAFDYTWIGSLAEEITLELDVYKQMPLRRVQGRIVLTSRCLYVQLFECIDGIPMIKIQLTNVTRCAKRKIFGQSISVEIYDGPTPHMLVFGTEAECDRFWRAACKHENIPILRTNTLEHMTHAWQHGKMSTYDYLMNLNWAAGRSLNDLSQYPIMPWIIKDYTSKTLDLDNPGIYRDLGKPIGALNMERLEGFKVRMRESDEGYLYGTHYSCPSYVMYYLVREKPEWMLLVHNGKFDKGERLFNDLSRCWANVATLTNDVKELIPQFYNGTAKFLEGHGLDLGPMEDGTRVPDNVTLPPWAASPKDLIRTLREALEGKYASENIHKWIDLIFGYQSRGRPALEADNLFHPLTYEADSCTGDDLDSIAKRTQITEFGQCPQQLFSNPHPRRVVETTESWGITDDLQPAMEVADISGIEIKPLEDILKISEFQRENSIEVVDNHEFVTTNVVGSMKKRPRGSVGVHLGEVPDYLSRLMHAAYKESAQHGDALGLDDSYLDAVIIAGEQGQVPVIDTVHGTRLRTLQMGAHDITGITCSAKTWMVFGGSVDGHLYQYDLKAGRLLDRINAGGPGLTAVETSRCGTKVAVGGQDGSVSIWVVRSSGEAVCDRRYVEHQVSTECVGWDDEGSCVISCGEEGLLVYDIRSSSMTPSLALPLPAATHTTFTSPMPHHAISLTATDITRHDLRSPTPPTWTHPSPSPSPTLHLTQSSIWYASSNTLNAASLNNGLSKATMAFADEVISIASVPSSDGAHGKICVTVHDGSATKTYTMPAGKMW
eukprot:TRINITY_DN1105_c0_g1_i1.p1 TRINITY_DN1105_c0_g1~~TRINITY_DN1105_c0_g1_i1.p1  ORF type:complete len:913 (+),score=131.97 TRINITY_DN1105_c0_g1_i1:97-2835(+)